MENIRIGINGDNATIDFDKEGYSFDVSFEKINTGRETSYRIALEGEPTEEEQAFFEEHESELEELIIERITE